MIGQMTKYEEYINSLEEMREPKPANLLFNMRAAVEYAEQKGVRISDLSLEEKERFITRESESTPA